ncbi:hypothetical protein D3C86_1422840 [compost metagenome]
MAVLNGIRNLNIGQVNQCGIFRVGAEYFFGVKIRIKLVLQKQSGGIQAQPDLWVLNQ